ncbi:hypothetical protein GCK32_010123, partial [Trichostrongylus colubriformis]
CDDVTILRCSNVCRRWRALIFTEERKPRSLVCRARDTVGIFIVDRRRAILEKMCPGSEPTKLTATRSECSLFITPSIRTPRVTRSSHNDASMMLHSMSQDVLSRADMMFSCGYASLQQDGHN